MTNTRLLVSRNKREGWYRGTVFLFAVHDRQVNKRVHERTGTGRWPPPSLRDWKRP